MKLFWLCLSLVFLPLCAVLAQGIPYDVSATQVDYDLKAGTVTASGGVTVTGKNGTVTSDRLLYDTKADILKAVGGVRWVDDTGNVVHVDELEMTDAMKRGTLEGLRLAMPNLGEVLVAKSASVSNTTYVLTDARYSPCPKCVGEAQAWDFRAQQVTYDASASTVAYRHAIFDVKGVPVMYMPYFSHPIGPKRPKNGLLPPVFGYSSVLGAETTQGYYVWSPKENADYTLRARMMAERGIQYQLERRQETEHTRSEVHTSYLNDKGTGKVRGHVEGQAEYVFQPGLRMGVNGASESDATYLNQFFGRTDPYLASTAFGEMANEDSYAALSATHFQDLSTTVVAKDTAQVMPHVELEKMLVMDPNGGQLLLHGDSLNLTSGNGAQYRRLIGEAEYSKPFLLDDGSRLRLTGTARADAYNVDGNQLSNGNTGRFLPEATALWTKPYISPAGTHTIAPTLMGAVSPRGGNPTNIPNEDSVAYELDVSNLFEPNRFAGLDRVETGPRLMYGLDNRWGPAAANTWRLFVGQSLRQHTDSTLPQSGGASTPASDWVGAFAANPVAWFSMGSRFRLDNATYTPRRVDNSLRFGTEEKGRLLLNYSFLDNGPEELNGDLMLPVHEKVDFLARYRDDLANSKLLLAEAGFKFKEDCYQVELVARRQGYTKADLRPSTDFLVNIKLLTLGED